jgi:hypothetical protein
MARPSCIILQLREAPSLAGSIQRSGRGIPDLRVAPPAQYGGGSYADDSVDLPLQVYVVAVAQEPDKGHEIVDLPLN